MPQKILLIDDDPISNFLTKAVVEETLTSDLDIDVAENGLKALEILMKCISVKNCPTYIFLDINMPVMDGFEFLEAVEEVLDKPQLKIIILSSSSAARDIRLAMNHKIIGFISKPLTHQKLQQVITHQWCEPY